MIGIAGVKTVVALNDEPQCAAVCPVDCCLPDPNNVESEELLMKKKDYLDSVDTIRLRS